MARRQRQQRASRQQRQQQQQQLSGGEGGATGFGQSAFGLPGQQEAVAGTTLLKVTPVNGGNGLALASSPFKGGSNQEQQQQQEQVTGGRGILNEVAVPALLLYANTVYKPGKSRKAGRRSRRSRSRSRKYRGKR